MEAVERLVKALRPERIYLFGSRARNDWREGSDYDLFIVLPGPGPVPHLYAQEAYRALRDVALPVDIVVWSEQSFRRQRAVIASLPATVAREGVLLYAA